MKLCAPAKAAKGSLFYGDCFEQCQSGEGLRFLSVMLLTLAVAMPVGVLTRNLVNRWTRDRS